MGWVLGGVGSLRRYGQRKLVRVLALFARQAHHSNTVVLSCAVAAIRPAPNQVLAKRIWALFAAALLSGVGIGVSSARAATIDITAFPKIVYGADGFTRYQTRYPNPYYDTPEAAFAAAKVYEDYCEPAVAGKVCYTAVNLHASGSRLNGAYFTYFSDLQQCGPNGCNVIFPNGTAGPVELHASAMCPEGVVGLSTIGSPVYFSLTQLTSDANGSRAICFARIVDYQPCKDCDARGDPVHPGTGQQFLVESDYVSPSRDLDFTRTYRSTNGHFASVATQAFVDNSVSGAIIDGCWPGSWTDPVKQAPQSYCFPRASYLAILPNYQLFTSDGHAFTFVGTPSAVTAQVGINDQVTQITIPGGSLQWLVRREANRFEVLSSTGHLLRKVTANGANDTSYVYSDAATRSSIAPRSGLLIGELDRFGRSLAFTFDSAANLSSMADPSGLAYFYSYDAFGNLANVLYPGGARRTYLYEGTNINGGAPCNDPNGDAIRRSGRLPMTGVGDELGSRFSTFQYDCYLRAVSTEESGGVFKYSFTYQGLNNSQTATTEVDPLGTSRVRSYAQTGSIMKPTGISQLDPRTASPVSTTFARDANGNVASVDDFNGSRACYASDLSRNLETARVEGLSTTTACSAVTAANASLPSGSRKTSHIWHPDWRLQSKVAEPGKLTTSIYNGQPDPFNSNAIASCAPATALLPDGKPTAVLCKTVEQATTDGDGHLGFTAVLQPGVANRVRSWTYTQYGQVLTAKDPLGNTTTNTYYPDTSFTGVNPNAVGHTIGDLQTVTNALGKVTSYGQYDKHGNLLQSTDPNGVVTTNSYDLRQRLLSTSVGGQTTGYTYDAAGQLLKVTAPDASWIGYEYDPAHRMTATKDNLGNRIEYVLDNAGNRTAENVKGTGGALRRTLARSIDALGRVQQTTGRE